MNDIASISAACGYITSQTLNAVTTGGTGYMIEPSRMATCAHVVDRADPETIRVKFHHAECVATILRIDHDNDCAILDVKDPPVAVKPLPLSSQCSWKAVWDGFGYPEVGKGTGVTTSGIISNPNARDDTSAEVLELTSPEAAAGMATPLHGFSGSPVVVDGVVVGHIKRFLSDPDNPMRAAFGKVYAVHAHRILSLLGQHPAAREAAPPAAGTARSAQQVAKILDLLEQWSTQDMPYERARRDAVELLIQLGEPMKALEVLDKPGGGLRSSQLRALALAKTRDPANLQAAVRILEDLWRKTKDAETGGLLAGRYKEQWQLSKRVEDLRKCHQTYLAAFDHSKKFYPGINAAATALWLGDAALSKRLARRVLKLLQQVDTPDRNVWYHATEAEAQLLLGDLQAAKMSYRRAVRRCDHAPETIRTMKSQAECTLQWLGRDGAELGPVFE